MSLISHSPEEIFFDWIAMPVSCANRGMLVVAAEGWSHVMTSSSEGFNAAAAFCTARRQYGQTFPVMSRFFVVTRIHRSVVTRSPVLSTG